MCLGRPVISAWMPCLASSAAQHLGDALDVALALGAALRQRLLHLGVDVGLQVAEGQVLQLPLDLPDAQAAGQRRVDVQRLARDAPLLLGAHVAQGAHVVQPVGQLDQHHAHIADHGQEHLAQALDLRDRGCRRAGWPAPRSRPAWSRRPPGWRPRARTPRPGRGCSVAVSSATSWSSAAATVCASRRSSARMPATASGWMM